ERERAVRVDRLPRRVRQRHERGMAAAEIGGVEFGQIIDMRARISERAAFGQPPLEAQDAMYRLQPRRRLQDLPALEVAERNFENVEVEGRIEIIVVGPVAS